MPLQQAQLQLECAIAVLQEAEAAHDAAKAEVERALGAVAIAKHPLTWRNVFIASRTGQGGLQSSDQVRLTAKAAGYPYFAWFDPVYMTEDASRTGFTIHDVQ
jgi:hypothetical protein